MRAKLDLQHGLIKFVASKKFKSHNIIFGTPANGPVKGPVKGPANTLPQ